MILRERFKRRVGAVQSGGCGEVHGFFSSQFWVETRGSFRTPCAIWISSQPLLPATCQQFQIHRIRHGFVPCIVWMKMVSAIEFGSHMCWLVWILTGFIKIDDPI